MAVNFNQKLLETEERVGRFIVSAKLDEHGDLTDVVWADCGPGDLVLDVYRGRVKLARAGRTDRAYCFADVLTKADYADGRVAQWLDCARRAAKGPPHLSRYYRLVAPPPASIAALIREREHEAAEEMEDLMGQTDRRRVAAAAGYPSTPDLLATVTQTALRLGIDPTTVYRLIRRGALAALKVGAHWRLRRAAVEDYVARHKGGA